MSRGDDAGRRPAGDQRGGDDDVDVLGLLGVQLRLAGLVVVAHLLGVAGGRHLGRRRIDVEILPAQRLDLVGDLGPRVGGPHDGAQAACRADGGQSGHTRADHEHLGRRHLARRGHLPGEEPAEGVRGLDDGAVPGDVGHRRQHVQRLRPGDPRDRVHRQHRDRAGGQLLDEFRVQRRRDQADQGGAVAASAAISSSVGALTLSTTSAADRSRRPMSAPASTNAASEKLEAAPAPDSTSTE